MHSSHKAQQYGKISFESTFKKKNVCQSNFPPHLLLNLAGFVIIILNVSISFIYLRLLSVIAVALEWLREESKIVATYVYEDGHPLLELHLGTGLLGHTLHLLWTVHPSELHLLLCGGMWAPQPLSSDTKWLRTVVKLRRSKKDRQLPAEAKLSVDCWCVVRSHCSGFICCSLCIISPFYMINFVSLIVSTKMLILKGFILKGASPYFRSLHKTAFWEWSDLLRAFLMQDAILIHDSAGFG